ncbi:ComEC/Rec2 family competence protein [Candidatus Poriferisodalis sp.]|uniref:ComEC/Rec2 family competence protein n=1 Tax=Candidatus Poriferisodalis sp. TaxID=3101277 RepID=UPI003AF91DD1
MADLAILDVGHGNCAVARDGERALVIDTGPGIGLLEYLRSQGISRINEILISHTDADHLRGLQRLLDENRFALDHIRLNSDAAQQSELWKSLAFSLDDRARVGGCQLSAALVEGESFTFGNECSVRILAPRSALAMTGPGSTDNHGRRITSNTISAVVAVEIHDVRVMLAGDLDEVGLEHLLESDQDLRSDVLVFPHHGGNVRANATASHNRRFAERLVEAVSPTQVIFSFGRSQRRNPRPEIVEAIRSTGPCKIMCTQMSARCSAEQSFDEAHLSSAFASGRSRKHCCAGTIVVSAGVMRPLATEHSAFVERSTSSPLCIGEHTNT